MASERLSRPATRDALTIDFSVEAPPLLEQLYEQGWTLMGGATHEIRWMWAIGVLYANGLLTRTERIRAQERLVNRVRKAVAPTWPY